MRVDIMRRVSGYAMRGESVSGAGWRIRGRCEMCIRDRAQANGHVEIREMADRIQKTCTVTRADVMAVRGALEDGIMEALEGGEIVRLADLVTFQIGLSGRGAETEEMCIRDRC